MIVWIWISMTLVGAVVMAWTRRDARRVRDKLSPGTPLHRLARYEVRQHSIILLVLLLHFLAGVLVVVGRYVPWPIASYTALFLVAAEVVLVYAAIRERRST